jgi:hypothetical protein
MSQLSPGTMVSYILGVGKTKGQARPAMVMQHNFNQSNQECDLWVFMHPTRDDPPAGGTGGGGSGMMFVQAAKHDVGLSPGTWS